MNQRRQHCVIGKSPESGYTLIEALVAAAVMSIGLLSLAALQTVTLTKNHGSYVRTQANNLGHEIIDAIRANMDNVNDYIGSVSADECDPDFERGDTNIASDDLDEWENNLACLLPEGSGDISIDATTNILTVEITWNDSHYESQGENTEDNQQITLETIL